MHKHAHKKPLGYHIWQVTMAGMLLLAFSAILQIDLFSLTAPDQEITRDDLGEFMMGDTLYTGTISGIYMGEPFHNVPVQYTLVNGLPIYQGDIILDLDGPTQAGIGLPDAASLWPGGIVPYEINRSLPNQQRIHDAIAHWEAHTSLRFVERTSSNAGQYPNWIEFKPSFGCSSYVGMRGGKQPINLATGCSTGNTIHEIGHAIGLWHEHSRADRDEFVDVRYENIVASAAFNFDKQIDNGEDIGDYDYGSIMHYPRWAFSKNGQDTIVPHDPDAEIGQRQALSADDIAAVEYLYDRVR